MRDLNLLVFLTQLGFTVAFPLAGFVLLAIWLRDTFGLGAWVIWVGLALGLICAVTGFRDALKTMDRMCRDKKKEDPPVSFNEHN